MSDERIRKLEKICCTLSGILRIQAQIIAALMEPSNVKLEDDTVLIFKKILKVMEAGDGCPKT